MSDSVIIPKWKLLDMKMEFMGPIRELMKKEKFTKGDIGKFYVMARDKRSGRVMTYDEMFALDLNEIGGWYNIADIDVD